MKNILKLLPRLLHAFQALGKNIGKVLTNSPKYVQSNAFIFRPNSAQKRDLAQKLKKINGLPRILSRNEKIQEEDFPCFRKTEQRTTFKVFQIQFEFCLAEFSYKISDRNQITKSKIF